MLVVADLTPAALFSSHAKLSRCAVELENKLSIAPTVVAHLDDFDQFTAPPWQVCGYVVEL